MKLEKQQTSKDSYRFQYAVAFSGKITFSLELTNLKKYFIAASLAYFSTAQAGGWNSPSIPKLVADDSPIPINNDEGSWLVISAIVGLLITSYPAGLLMDR